MQGTNHDNTKWQTQKEARVMADLLSTLDIIASDRYVTVESQDELDIYVSYITYRVQQDFMISAGCTASFAICHGMILSCSCVNANLHGQWLQSWCVKH